MAFSGSEVTRLGLSGYSRTPYSSFAKGADREVLANTVALTITTYPAQIDRAREVLAKTSALTITTYPATISDGTVVITTVSPSGAPSKPKKLKRIMIGNELFVIKSPEHERYLLQRYLDKQQTEFDRLIVAKKLPVVKKKIKLVSTQIVRVQSRLKKAEKQVWRQKMQVEDEEILLLLAM